MISTKIINKLLCVFVALTAFSACKNSDIGKDLVSSTDTIAVGAAKKIIDPDTPGDPSFKYDSTKRYIYFTFDDGPQPGTMNCFHIVRELGIKASFFMIGVQIDSKGLEKRVDSIRNSYPQILLCNHSFTHGNFNHYKSYYNNPDSAARDVIKAQTSMRVPLKIFRAPSINVWNINGRMKGPQLTKPLVSLLGTDGYEVAGWDVEWRFETDGGSIPVQTANQMIREIQNAFRNNNETFVRNNVVVLTHDRMFAKRGYADSLRKVITAIKQDKQIIFETMDHYPGIYRK